MQIAPVKKIGAILFGNQINEELVHAPDADAGKELGKKLYKSDFYIVDSDNEKKLLARRQGNYYNFSSLLPQNHAGDIHTPPPNFLN
jgi:hypothetical protein